MGLFNDYASALGLNEGVTYFNEAELREEMENLEAMPDYEFDENSDIEECCIQALLINEQNYANIMMHTAGEEMKQIMESGTDVITEASLGGFIDKLKSMVDKAWEKIKSIYNKCMAAINSWISTDKRFVEKYADTIRNADTKCFKFFGYDIPSDISKTITGRFVTLEQNMKEEFNRLTTGKYTNGNEKGIEDYTKSNVKDRFVEILGKDTPTPEQYIHQLKTDLKLDKKVKIEKLTSEQVIKELKEGKDNKKNIKESYKAAKASIAAMKKDIDYLKKFSKKPDENSRSKPNFGLAGTLCSKTLSVLQQVQRVGIKAQNILHHNCRKAAARAVRGVTDSNDSTNESFEGFDLGGYASSNREFGFLV